MNAETEVTVAPGEAVAAQPSRGRALAILLLTAGVVIGVDHITKAIVVHDVAFGSQVPADGPVTIHLVHNTGAAFSILPNAQWLFLAIAALVSVYIVLAGHRFGRGAGTQVTLGLVLGGALANAADRLAQGYVVDFVDLHRWPIFNVADSAIVVGILVALFTFGRSSSPPADPAPTLR